MSTSIINYSWFQIPATVYSVTKNLSSQKKMLRKKVDPFLEEALQHNDGSISDIDLKKIRQYYGLAVPAVLGEAFCALRGRQMEADERWVSTCQGAITGLFDDFFDEQYLDDLVIESKVTGGLNHQSKRSNERLFDLFYSNALEHSANKEMMQQALLEVYHAQVASKKQKDASISKDEIWDITVYKGGASLLFYRTAFSPATTAAEKELYYKLGGLMQLANDIFDVYKDREAGISTLVTRTDHIQNIYDLLKNNIQAYFSEAYHIGFNKRHVKQFLNIISVCIFSRCFVCLEQLQKNEQLTGNRFSVHDYSRKNLICDMDTKKNMLRSAAYHVKLMKL